MRWKTYNNLEHDFLAREQNPGCIVGLRPAFGLVLSDVIGRAHEHCENSGSGLNEGLFAVDLLLG